MELIVDNYREIEQKYPGYTMKKEAATLITYCHTRGWPDLLKRAMSIFGMDVLDIVPDRLFIQINNKDIKTMAAAVHNME